jgi:VIT1/CCC1 family predicted Fe2+/Mn2+ transporter
MADTATWLHHWQDESDAAYLYRVLATVETDADRRGIYERLAAVEDRHVVVWAELLRREHVPPGPHRPGGRTRLLAWLGRRFGPGALLPLLLSEEGREVKGYLAMHRSTPVGAAGHEEALTLARESKQHAGTLAAIRGSSGEPWHRTSSGGLMRSVIYGFNDGLTANFGLVAGVIGATADAQHHAVIVAGIAGLIADSLSMGSSGFLAAKSEQEVYANEIAMERDEIALMPEVERDEMALIYEARGIPRDVALELANRAMAEPERMLAEQVREELGIDANPGSPMREAWITGTATAVGAFLPVFPFLVFHGAIALWLSFAVAMLSHFAVGAARSIFTGRGIFRSGIDMFVVGLGVAIVGYYVGAWVGRLIG